MHETHKENNPSLGRNIFEFFCVSLCTEFFFDLYKNFQVAFIYDKNMITDAQTHSHTHRPTDKNVIFGLGRPQYLKIHKNPHFDNLTPNL